MSTIIRTFFFSVGLLALSSIGNAAMSASLFEDDDGTVWMIWKVGNIPPISRSDLKKGALPGTAKAV